MSNEMARPNVLALSASLRNARWGQGVDGLLDAIKDLGSKEELMEFMSTEAKLHLDAFVESGREDGVPFDELYKRLRKNSGRKGLCNSEVGMVAALWSMIDSGCDVDYQPLSSNFGPNGKSKKLGELKMKVMAADALLLVTPVYFGDRSSLASDFIEFLRSDPEIRESLAGKPMAGIAVGAKRNGGQETALVYQIVEMTAMGMLGVGNDSETTAQYGGTLLGGDIGTAADDGYGLATAMGAGRRLAHVSKLLARAGNLGLKGKLRVLVWILQDSDGYALQQMEKLEKVAGEMIQIDYIFASDAEVARCIACDICPTEVGKDAEYRCIIKRKADVFVKDHAQLLDYDMIVPVALSPNDRSKLKNTYQRFIERTRYLRRGDYLFSDVVVMPLVFSEVGTREALEIRMMTSLIRHHTLVSGANIGYVYNGKLINEVAVIEQWKMCLEQAKKVACGRMVEIVKQHHLDYNPVGYVLSAAKNDEGNVVERRKVIHSDREKRRETDAVCRLAMDADT